MSTWRKKGNERLGWAKVGPWVTALIRVSNAFLHSGVQANGWFFLVRLVNGLAMLA